MPALAPFALVATLAGCGASDGAEPISQAEAELALEGTQPTGAPSADGTDTDDEQAAAKGPRGRHGQRHGPKDPAKMIEHLDANGDGALQLSELPEHKQKRLAGADTDGNGALSVEELKAHFAAGHEKRGHGRRHAGHGPPSPEKFIGHFDADGNGTVELAELPARMSEKMAKADTNGDGSLTADELEQGMRSFAKQRFSDKDANGDGFLTESEVKPQHWKWLGAADANADGQVSFDEITQAFEAGTLKPPHGHGHGHKGHKRSHDEG